jgi:uncharacterized damage-inducible protein DinB
MALTPRDAADERDLLSSWLAHGRYLLTLTAHGLTDDQAHAQPTASSLSIAGLIAHSGAVERSWLNEFSHRDSDGSGKDDPAAAFVRAADESLAQILKDYHAAGANTDALVATVDDLGQPFPASRGSWFGEVDTWSLRWLLQHLIVQTARHTGHADIIRETIDGGTWIPLVAAAERWPPDGKSKPWTATG